jgi:hypothetical protein
VLLTCHCVLETLNANATLVFFGVLLEERKKLRVPGALAGVQRCRTLRELVVVENTVYMFSRK